MAKVYKFGEYNDQKLNEDREGSIPAIFLIKKTGQVIEKRGNIVFEQGIFDESNYNYLAAIGEDMQLYTTSKDTNSLFKFITSGLVDPENSNNYQEDNETFNEGFQGADNSLEKYILNKMGISKHSTIIQDMLNPVDEGVESWNVDGIEILVKLYPDATVVYKIQ